MSNSGKKPTDEDEVEQLLRAAQDDMLLKLSLNSHMARASSSAAIDPDLDRRFQALKKPQKPTNDDDSTKTKTDARDKKADSAAAADNDLNARFAALKKSIPSYGVKENRNNFASDESVDQPAADEDDEDEVEKVIKWAIDAARLDPSPPSSSSDDDDEDDGGNGGDRRVEKGGRSKRK